MGRSIAEQYYLVFALAALFAKALLIWLALSRIVALKGDESDPLAGNGNGGSIGFRSARSRKG